MFLFSLAEHLHMPVGELLKRMDSRELSEWIAYFKRKKNDARRDALSEQAGTLKNKAKADLRRQMKGK